MLRSYEDLVRRAQFFSLTCDIKDENGVVHHFHNGHEYVKIGGMKWATMNIGAEKPTDCGFYFQWGDTSGYTAAQVGDGARQKVFTWEDYKYGNGSSSTRSISMTKYNSTDGKKALDVEDDGVAVNWGGKWRMPTSGEIKTLGGAVTTAWTSNYKGSGVRGLVCTAKDGSGVELFFPAAGNCYDGGMNLVGSIGNYWSSSLNFIDSQQAYGLLFYDGGVYWQCDRYCFLGRSLRGVVSE